MHILGLLLLVYVPPPVQDNPVAKVPLGKEGHIDYKVALNERLGKRITPEKNANVLIWQALDPKPEGGRDMPPAFFKTLGIAAPPEKGDYFVDLDRYLQDKQALGELNEILKQLELARQRPWSAKQFATSGPARIARLLLSQSKPERTVGTMIGDSMVAMLMPATRKVQQAADRIEQVKRNQQIAFALAAYRLENGRYPATLAELEPKYLVALPGDLFSGRTLIYRPEKNGYLFYSVGVNGKDDDGHWYDDDPPGDDIRVRLPLPRLTRR